MLVGLTREAFAGDPAGEQARLFNEFHALTVAVGKAHCGRTARCEGCPLAGDLRIREGESRHSSASCPCQRNLERP